MSDERQVYIVSAMTECGEWPVAAFQNPRGAERFVKGRDGGPSTILYRIQSVVPLDPEVDADE